MAFAIQHEIPIFDALLYTKRLTAVGVPTRQAEVQAETMRELINEQLATKVDLKMLEERLGVRFTLLDEDIKHTNQRLEENIKYTNQRIELLDKRIRLSEERTNEQIKALGERTNEQFNSLAERINLSEKRTNERIDTLIERIGLSEERTNERFIALDVRISAISGKLLIKLGSLIVGSFAVLGVVIPLILK